jgi:hypothetical protein
VVAIFIVNLFFGRETGITMALRRTPNPLPKYGKFPGKQGKPGPWEKPRAESGFYGRVSAKTSRGNSEKGWIWVSPVLRLKRRITEVEGGTPSTRSSVYLRR